MLLGKDKYEEISKGGILKLHLNVDFKIIFSIELYGKF